MKIIPCTIWFVVQHNIFINWLTPETDGTLSLLVRSLLRQVLQSNKFCNFEWGFCTSQQVFWSILHKQTAPLVSWFEVVPHTRSKGFRSGLIEGHIRIVPDHDKASSMFHSRDSHLFLVCFIFASVNIELMCFAKKFVLSSLSIGNFPRSWIDLSTYSLANCSLSFLWFILNRGVLFGNLPCSPFWLKWQQMVWFDTVPWPWCSPLN